MIAVSVCLFVFHTHSSRLSVCLDVTGICGWLLAAAAALGSVDDGVQAAGGEEGGKQGQEAGSAGGNIQVRVALARLVLCGRRGCLYEGGEGVLQPDGQSRGFLYQIVICSARQTCFSTDAVHCVLEACLSGTGEADVC